MRERSLFENDPAAQSAQWVLLGAWRATGGCSGTPVGTCNAGHPLRKLSPDRSACFDCGHEYARQPELFRS